MPWPINCRAPLRYEERPLFGRARRRCITCVRVRRIVKRADIAFAGAYRRPTGRGVESRLDPTCRSGRSGHALWSHLHADIRARAPVDAGGLQRVQRRIFAVGTNPHGRSGAGMHTSGMPNDGFRKRVHPAAWRKQRRHALGRPACVVLRARRLAVQTIVGTSPHRKLPRPAPSRSPDEPGET